MHLFMSKQCSEIILLAWKPSAKGGLWNQRGDRPLTIPDRLQLLKRSCWMQLSRTRNSRPPKPGRWGFRDAHFKEIERQVAWKLFCETIAFLWAGQSWETAPVPASLFCQEGITTLPWQQIRCHLLPGSNHLPRTEGEYSCEFMMPLPFE